MLPATGLFGLFGSGTPFCPNAGNNKFSTRCIFASSIGRSTSFNSVMMWLYFALMFSKFEICSLNLLFFLKASSAFSGMFMFKILRYFTSLSNCSNSGSKLTLRSMPFFSKMYVFCFSIDSTFAFSSHSVFDFAPYSSIILYIDSYEFDISLNSSFSVILFPHVLNLSIGSFILLLSESVQLSIAAIGGMFLFKGFFGLPLSICLTPVKNKFCTMRSSFLYASSNMLYFFSSSTTMYWRSNMVSKLSNTRNLPIIVSFSSNACVNTADIFLSSSLISSLKIMYFWLNVSSLISSGSYSSWPIRLTAWSHSAKISFNDVSSASPLIPPTVLPDILLNSW